MKSLFDHLNLIPTSLAPITEEYWNDSHKWAYDQIASKINSDHVVDVGCGCGLLGIYLVYTGKVKTADLYDPREPQITYAEDLVKHLGLQDKIKIYKEYAQPKNIQNSTVISTRFGSLPKFEQFFITNRLITLRRTKEVEPYFLRPINLPWTIEIVKRHDGFELELLVIDFSESVQTIIKNERWVEDINPTLKPFIDLLDIKEIPGIGQDISQY